jgi:hypothetical protein
MSSIKITLGSQARSINFYGTGFMNWILIDHDEHFPFALIYYYIQGDSGRICNTLGNDSMCDSKQKSSYEHGSDFERLPKYGKKNIRTILRARTVIT